MEAQTSKEKEVQHVRQQRESLEAKVEALKGNMSAEMGAQVGGHRLRSRAIESDQAATKRPPAITKRPSAIKRPSMSHQRAIDRP